MVRKSKWIQGTSPEEPVSRAARRALRARLATFWYYLPLAARKSDRDVEYVHQLRVSTRRAMAAVTLFAPLLPPKRLAWVEKQLRRVRRAAGDARDFDVLGRRLTDWAARHPAERRTALVQQIQSLRDKAQKPIRKAFADLSGRRFSKRSGKLARKTRWRGKGSEPTFAAAARKSLRKVAKPFFAASAAGATSAESLHQLRILGKQLRYSMEIFAAALDADFRATLYPLVEEIQEKLGEVNDHAAALDRFRVWKRQWDDPRLAESLAELIRDEEAALAKARRQFVRWWTPQRAAELEARFERFLAAHARNRDDKSA